jgi:hypothetical protein
MIEIIFLFALLILSFITFLWETKSKWLREQTGWKPWECQYGAYGDPGTGGRRIFTKEDSAIRYAYRKSLTAEDEFGIVRRDDQLIVCWRNGRIWTCPRLQIEEGKTKDGEPTKRR